MKTIMKISCILLFAISLATCSTPKKAACDAYGQVNRDKDTTFPETFDEAEVWMDQMHNRY